MKNSDRAKSVGSKNKSNEHQLVRIEGVFIANSTDGTSPVVFLENDSKKVLPIYVGATEAFSIHTALEKLPYPRPLTHDLLISVLERLNSEVGRVIIDDLNDGIFFARLIVKKNGDELEFDTRPSDGLALAIRADAPIFVSSKVMESAAVDKETYKIE